MTRWQVLMAAGLFAASSVAPAAQAATDGPAPPSVAFSFDGPFGRLDRAAAIRGFEVYRSVCAVCHGLRFLAWRNLADLGFAEDDIRRLAADTLVLDGPDDTGEMFERAGRPSDPLIPEPFPNAKAAAAANNGVAPPDLSLKVLERGAPYVYGILVGYADPPDGIDTGASSYNTYFPGSVIAMPQPLWGDDVTYADGTAATLEQEAHDVATFLAWAADPSADERKRMGLRVLVFLLVMTGVFYATYRRTWAPVKRGDDDL